MKYKVTEMRSGSELNTESFLNNRKSKGFSIIKDDTHDSVNIAPKPMVEVTSTKTSSPSLARSQTKLVGGKKDGKRVKLETLPYNHPTEVRNKVVSAVQDVLKAFEFCGFESSGYSVKGTIKHWASIASEPGMDWMQLLKYKLAAFYSYHTRDPTIPADLNELPICPFKTLDNPGVLLGGRAFRWQRYVLCPGEGLKLSFKGHQLLTTILNLKKGLPRPTSEFIEKQIQNTVETLTTQQVRPQVRLRQWADVVDEDRHVSAKVSNIIEEAKRTTHELFQGTNLKGIFVDAYMPSLSANYNNTLSKLGTLGHFRDLGYLQDHSVIPIVRRVKKNVDEYIENEQVPRVTEFYYLENKAEIQQLYDETFVKVLNDVEKEDSLAKPVGLAEPLKVRVITKGPPLLYYILKPLQKFMWKKLKSMKVFELIGKPVSEEILQRTFKINATRKMESNNQFFVSVDYKSATDMLDPSISEAIVNELCDIWQVGGDSVLRRLFVRSLTRHKFSVPSDWKQYWLNINRNKGEMNGLPFTTNEQVWGQLMGSITSFIILCIANASVCRMAMESGSKRKLLLDSLPLRINGDDAVFRGNPQSFRDWKVISKNAGLSPSVGKVYVSREFLNINSTTFICGQDGIFKLVKYINFGLMKGMKRSEGGVTLIDAVSEYDSLGARHRELHRLTPDEQWNAVSKSFRNYHYDILQKAGVPWYIPERLGGLGLVGQPSVKDLIIARAMINNLLPKKGQPCIVKNSQLTQIHKVAMSYMPDIPMIPVEGELRQYQVELADALQTFVSFLYMAVVYATPSLVKTDSSISSLKLLDHNRRLWQDYNSEFKKFGKLKPFIDKQRLEIDKRAVDIGKTMDPPLDIPQPQTKDYYSSIVKYNSYPAYRFYLF